MYPSMLSESVLCPENQASIALWSLDLCTLNALLDLETFPQMSHEWETPVIWLASMCCGKNWVTSVNSLSSLSSLNEDEMFSLKSFHCRQSFSVVLIFNRRWNYVADFIELVVINWGNWTGDYDNGHHYIWSCQHGVVLWWLRWQTKVGSGTSCWIFWQ